jgi:hypothetical protein
MFQPIWIPAHDLLLEVHLFFHDIQT